MGLYWGPPSGEQGEVLSYQDDRVLLGVSKE